MPDLEFYMCGLVGQHLTRASRLCGAVVRRNIHKGSIYLAMTPACSDRNDEGPSAKDSISEFVQPLELLVDCIARRDLN